jgi:hypothetical protein
MAGADGAGFLSMDDNTSHRSPQSVPVSTQQGSLPETGTMYVAFPFAIEILLTGQSVSDEVFATQAIATVVR